MIEAFGHHWQRTTGYSFNLWRKTVQDEVARAEAVERGLDHLRALFSGRSAAQKRWAWSTWRQEVVSARAMSVLGSSPNHEKMRNDGENVRDETDRGEERRGERGERQEREGKSCERDIEVENRQIDW